MLWLERSSIHLKFPRIYGWGVGGLGGPGLVDVGGGGGVVSEGAVCCKRSNCHLALHSDGVRRILAPTEAQLGRALESLLRLIRASSSWNDHGAGMVPIGLSGGDGSGAGVGVGSVAGLGIALGSVKCGDGLDGAAVSDWWLVESSEFGEWLLALGAFDRRGAGVGSAVLGVAGGGGLSALVLMRWCLVEGGCGCGLRVRFVAWWCGGCSEGWKCGSGAMVDGCVEWVDVVGIPGSRRGTSMGAMLEEYGWCGDSVVPRCPTWDSKPSMFARMLPCSWSTNRMRWCKRLNVRCASSWSIAKVRRWGWSQKAQWMK